MDRPSEPRLPVTVVIPALNEERNLPSCLARLGDFASVWVVDSGSSDRTAEIAAAHGARVIRFSWNGRFPKKRNWVLLNDPPPTPWVLFLDADELVVPGFIDELRRTLPTTSHTGFWIEYSNHFMGRRLRHGAAMSKLALFRVGSGLYERIEEDSWSRLDMEVHEHPVLEGTQGRLEARIEHDDDRGLHAYLARHNEYSTWEAERFVRLPPDRSAWTSFTSDQRRKYASLDRWWLAPAYFAHCYIVKRGFLDGGTGLAFAILKGIYFFQIRLKILERRRRRTRDG